MIRRALIVLVGLAASALALGASDIWKSKPISEWTREETQQFFRGSPWVRVVTLGGGLVDTSAPGGVAGDREGSGESSAAAGREEAPSEFPAAGRESGARPTPYFIEWSSARITREAALHMKALQGGAKGSATEPSLMPVYVLTIAGPNLEPFKGATQEQLKANTYLKAKHSKTRILPTEVRILTQTADHVTSVQFAFPRKLGDVPLLSDNEKSVEFSCKVKNLTLKTTFDLTRMVTEQGRDL